MDTPGYDPVSVTGQVAGGANLICFTTGRGSCFGCKPAPSLKLATDAPMYNRMQDDMDLNCGTIAEGQQSIAKVGAAIYRLLLATASGRNPRVSSGLWRGRVRTLAVRGHAVAGAAGCAAPTPPPLASAYAARRYAAVKPRITVITLGTDDLEAAVRFYREGLGLKTAGIISKNLSMAPSPSLTCKVD